MRLVNETTFVPYCDVLCRNNEQGFVILSCYLVTEETNDRPLQIQTKFALKLENTEQKEPLSENLFLIGKLFSVGEIGIPKRKSMCSYQESNL